MLYCMICNVKVNVEKKYSYTECKKQISPNHHKFIIKIESLKKIKNNLFFCHQIKNKFCQKIYAKIFAKF